MADRDFKNDGVPEITRREHVSKNIEAKRSLLYGYDANSDSLLPIKAVDNGDGTYSLGSSVPGSATSAKQDTGNTTLSSINTNVNKDSTGYTFYSSKITTTAGGLITPATGKALKIHKVLVTNSANNSTFVDVSLTGSTKGTFLQGEAIASSWVTTLAINETLTIGTDVNGTVYVNIQYEEI